MNNHTSAINHANYELKIGMKVQFVGVECRNNTTNPIPSDGIGTIRSIKTSSQNPKESATYVSVWLEEWTGEVNGHLLIPAVEKKTEEKKSEGIDFVELSKIWGEWFGPLPVEFHWRSTPHIRLIGTISFPNHSTDCYFADFFDKTSRVNDQIVVTKVLTNKCDCFISVCDFYHKVRVGDVVQLKGLDGFYKVQTRDTNNQIFKAVNLNHANNVEHTLSPVKCPIVKIYREV